MRALTSGITIEQRLAEVGRPSGFDYMRLILTVFIMACHSLEITHGLFPLGIFSSHPIRPFLALPLAAFSCLGGFLVASSLENAKNIFAFLGLRVLRIGPALAAEVILSAVILGPLLTVFPLSVYFSDPLFWEYFKNIIGDIQYVLPGLFYDNPIPMMVDPQLWTIPYELGCYMLLTILAVLGFYRRGVLLFAALWSLYMLHILAPELTIRLRSFTVDGATFILCFIAGIILYRYRKYIPLNKSLFLLSVLLAYGLLYDIRYDCLAAVPLTYAIVYLGLRNPPRHKYLLSGDYSYALFLYSYVVQQAVATVPQWRIWYVNFAIALPLAFAFAVLSWWTIERPALSLRHHLKR